jgi:hypothetical protein
MNKIKVHVVLDDVLLYIIKNLYELKGGEGERKRKKALKKLREKLIKAEELVGPDPRFDKAFEFIESME